MKTRRVIGVLAAVALVGANARGARAQSNPAQASPLPTLEAVTHGQDIELSSALEPELHAQLVASVRGLLARRGVSLRNEATTRSRTIARITVARRDDGQLGVRVVGAARGQVDERVIPRASEAIMIEQVAHVVDAAVEALQEVEAAPPPAAIKPAPVTRPAQRSGASAAAPPMAGAPFDQRGLALDVHVAGALTMTHASALAVPTVGGGIGVAFARGVRRAELWLTGSYRAPATATSDVVDVSAAAVSMRAAPTLVVLQAPTWLVEAGPSLGVDVWLSALRSSVLPANRLRDDTTRVSPTLGAVVGVRYAIVPQADLFLLAGIDIDLAPPRYLARVGPDTSVILEPWRVRPSLQIGIALNVLGPAPYPISGAVAARSPSVGGQ
jgi:hypothetical protein